MDPDPAKVQPPDPTPLFCDLKDAKKTTLFIFFSYNLPAFLLNVCLKILFCKHLFQSTQHLYEKREPDPKPDLEPDPDPYLWLMDPDPGGRPQNMRILRIWIRFRIRIPNTG